MELANTPKKMDGSSFLNNKLSLSPSPISPIVEGEVFYCQTQSPFIQDIWTTYNLYRWYPRYLILNQETNVLRIHSYTLENNNKNENKHEYKHGKTSRHKRLTKEIKLVKPRVRVWNHCIKRPLAFVVKDGDMFYTFNCNTKEEKHQWVEHLLNCLEKENKKAKEIERFTTMNPLFEVEQENDNDGNDYVKGHSLWTEWLQYILSHSSIQLQRLPRMRWTTISIYFILGLGLTIYIAWQSYQNFKQFQYITPALPTSNSVVADICYTTMTGTYYLDINGYFNTDTDNYMKTKSFLTMDFDAVQVPLNAGEEFKEKLQSYLQNEINEWNTQCIENTANTGILQFQCFLYLSTYYKKIYLPSFIGGLKGTISVRANFNVDRTALYFVPLSINTMYSYNILNDGTVITYNTYSDLTNIRYQYGSLWSITDSTEIIFYITPIICMFNGTYYDNCISSVGVPVGTYQICSCSDFLLDDGYNNRFYSNYINYGYCPTSTTTNLYPCNFTDLVGNEVDPFTNLLKAIPLKFRWKEMMLALKINDGSSIGQRMSTPVNFASNNQAFAVILAYLSGGNPIGSTLLNDTVTYDETFPDMTPLMGGNLSQLFNNVNHYSYDTFNAFTSSSYRPMLIESYYDNATSINFVIVSLDYYPLNHPRYRQYFCPFYVTNRSDCSPMNDMPTGAGIQGLIEPLPLTFEGGFLYEKSIPPLQLKDYNPVATHARTYICSYGTYNVLSQTLAATYATVTPLLSLISAIIIMFVLFQIRYLYGQDIQQLYYQEIDNNSEFNRKISTLTT